MATNPRGSPAVVRRWLYLRRGELQRLGLQFPLSSRLEALLSQVVRRLPAISQGLVPTHDRATRRNAVGQRSDVRAAAAGKPPRQDRDPFAGSLRYHLGLLTPNSERCRIVVDGQAYHWRDGEAVMFDETFVHWAENTTDKTRLILSCDIERPLNNLLVRALNRSIGRAMIRAVQRKMSRAKGWACSTSYSATCISSD